MCKLLIINLTVISNSLLGTSPHKDLQSAFRVYYIDLLYICFCLLYYSLPCASILKLT